METVKSFNAELSSLYEMKPPISKAKMTAITKGAIKAVKFYKHVVQSVEKFLQKCRPEYKIPGLYVIDSIVRQSRHQFGADKDVFAPRFSKNVTYTFYFIYQCTAEEKSKVIRVLNLWQKNAVFPPEVIQPLFDMADSNHPKYKEVAQHVNSKGASSSSGAPKAHSQDTNLNGSKEAAVSFDETSNDGNQSQSLVMGNLPNLSSTEMSLATRLQHLQHLFGQEPPPTSSAAQPTPSKAPNDTGQIRFNKKLLDFDYDEEDEEPAAKQQPPQPVQAAPTSTTSSSAETLGNLLTNPDILRHLQSLQQQIAQPVVQSAAINTNHHHYEEPPTWEPAQYNQVDFTQPPPGFIPMGHPPMGFPPFHPPTIREDLFQPGEVVEIEPPRTKERDRRRSRSGSRGRRASARRRSRTRSRSRDRGTRRRSRSRSRTTRRPRSRDREDREKERLEREKDRDRKRRGLPDIKKEFLSVCSTTLWVGHLSKLVQQEELSDTFGQYGEILSIDLIPPRGCAFVCMHRRQDAYRALTKLAGHKLQGKAITLAWAPGKGVKAKEWKDFWEVAQGVSYVPWNRLSQMTDLVALEEGGSFDEETLPPWMRQAMDQMDQPTTSGFVAEVGPPTPEMNEPMSTASGPSSLTTTTQLPANLPTYAPMAPPIGLLPVPIGMPPGLRLPPPGAHHLLLGQAGNAAMATHLLGQSILAGLGAAAAGPSGFFFNPAHLHQQTMQTNEMDAADDMELEEADDDVHHKEQMDGRRWNETTQENKNVQQQPPGLLERLRSLANHEVDHNGSDLAASDALYGVSPNLASSLRGAPLTAAAAEMGIRLLRGGPPESFGREDPFMSRHLGGASFGADNFGQMRGRHFGHEGRGGGFRGGEMGEPSWTDEEPLPPPPRWRQQQDDWPDRDPPPRHWDRERDRGRGDWSSPRRPPPPPLPARNERGRDRYGGRGDRGSDRRRSGDRDREPPPTRERERRTSERRGGRWSDRKSPDPPPVPPSVVVSEEAPPIKSEETSSAVPVEQIPSSSSPDAVTTSVASPPPASSPPPAPEPEMSAPGTEEDPPSSAD